MKHGRMAQMSIAVTCRRRPRQICALSRGTQLNAPKALESNSSDEIQHVFLAN